MIGTPNIGVQRPSAFGLAAEAGSLGLRVGAIAVFVAVWGLAGTWTCTAQDVRGATVVVTVVGWDFKALPTPVTVKLLPSPDSGSKSHSFEKATDTRGNVVFENVIPGTHVVRAEGKPYLAISTDPIALEECVVLNLPLMIPLMISPARDLNGREAPLLPKPAKHEPHG